MALLQWDASRPRLSSRGGLLRHMAVLLQCGAALVACGGGSGPDASSAAEATEQPVFRASSATVVETTLLPPEIRPHNRFGMRTVLRDNGNTLIVAAPGDPVNPETGRIDRIEHWGSIHIFTRDGAGSWQQTALLRPTTGPMDEYGAELAVSGDGNTIAVGAPEDRSRGSGIGSDPRDHEPYPFACPGGCVVRFVRGAVWVYVKQGGIWQLQEFIKAAQPADGDLFGYSVALSHDGNTMAVGAINDGGGGAVHLFRRDAAGRWAQADILTASNPSPGAGFGAPVRLSADGSVLAVGATGEMSADCRIDGNQHDRSQPLAGAVYVFERTGDRMLQRAYIKACDRRGQNEFGAALAIDPTGALLVVGAPGEDAEVHSCSVHTVPEQPRVGRAYVFTRSSAGWARSGALGASNSSFGDEFGSNVKMSADGSTLAIGARGEDGGLTGVNPPQGDDSVQEAGAIYVFRRGANATFAQTHYIKPPRTGRESHTSVGDGRHAGLDLSDNGSTLVLGSPAGGPTVTDHPGSETGAVYLYDELF